MAGARAAGARVVGKANLVELAFGASGVNEVFGTPVNPLDSRLVPGGSSSGSAVAVALGLADVAYGSDTGGSVRVPSAFCGTVGLKTTFGRVPLEGVRPLSPSLDTIGPMAADVAGTIVGMGLLEPGFELPATYARRVGRIRTPGLDVDPVVDAAVDRALQIAELEVVELVVEDWEVAYSSTTTILEREAALTNAYLLSDPTSSEKLGVATRARLTSSARISDSDAVLARSVGARWVQRFVALFDQVEVLALPTVAFLPPRLEEAQGPRYTLLTNPVNLAGLPALSLPAASSAAMPGSVQLVGPAGSEGLLLSTGLAIEHALVR